MDKFIKPSFFKAVGIFIVTSAVGIAVVAKAADVLPAFSVSRKGFVDELSKELSDPTNPNQLRLFSMEVLNDASRTENFEVSIVERGRDIKATLRIKPATPGAEVKAYETTVTAVAFAEFWMRLRELEVEQLTNLSPSTENIGVNNDRSKRFSSVRTRDSSSYRFKFQDGLEDYPNSFDVYSLEALQDTRYRKLRDLTEAFVIELFGADVVQ